MSAGFRAYGAREAKRLQAKIRREAIRELRARIRDIRRRRRATLKEVRVHCRTARCRLRDKIQAVRAKRLQELKTEIATMRAGARARCAARIDRVKTAGATQIQLERVRIREQKELAREVAAAEGRLRERHSERERSRRAESDDDVRGNLPPELVPVFNHIKRSIHAGPRISRTEAFLQWVEENPDEVLSIQVVDSDAATDRMIRELQELEREHARMRGAA
jgi:hypothetical protein